MSYRSEFNKVYTKLSKIAQKGTDGKFEYYEYIDELIDNGRYSLLEDVMNDKFRIDIKRYQSIQIFKHKTFDIVRQNVNSSFQVELKKLFDAQSVYNVGFHFFNKTNNHYLGDIKEIEQIEPYIFYKDPKLVEKQDQSRIINIEVTKGLPESIINAIPAFETSVTSSVQYNQSTQVRYLDNIYECLISYIYSSENQILPTNLNYWTQSITPTYSAILISDDQTTLFDKYTEAINLVKTFN